MIVNLIKPKKIFSTILPTKVKGQYWVNDIDENGEPRQLLRIEADEGKWIFRSSSLVTVMKNKAETAASAELLPQSCYDLRIAGSQDRAILFSEKADESRQTFRKLVVKGTSAVFSIGRSEECDLSFRNTYVSSSHARLTYEDGNWSITDSGSTNGTFVNGFRIESANLLAGDVIYIMGLKIVIGHNFLALNDPDHQLTVNTDALVNYQPQQIKESSRAAVLPEQQRFYRSPRFYRQVQKAEISIDPPPQKQRLETVPLALMLGPSLTMGLTSMSTGILALNNVIVNNGDMMQAVPTLVMSGSMLMGTVLWPILTKKHEKKQAALSEKKRQEKYMTYLEHVRDEVKRAAKMQSDILHENCIPPESCAERITTGSAKLWERSTGQSDFMRLRLGIGVLPIDLELHYDQRKFSMEDDLLLDAMSSLATEPKQLTGVPISVSFREHLAVGICGDHSRTMNMLRSLILQAVTLHGYDELKLMLITDEADAPEWDFVRALPHFWTDDRAMRFFAANVDEVKELSVYLEQNVFAREEQVRYQDQELPVFYLIVCTSKRLQDKCEALRQMLGQKKHAGFSCLFSASSLKDLPKETKLVIELQETFSRMYDRDDSTGSITQFQPDQVNAPVVAGVAQELANIELDLSARQYTLPAMMTFLEMFGVSKLEHLNPLTRWKENNPTISLQTPVGVDGSGETFYLDLHEKYHGPHGLVAGMTGSGKSEFIITYILSMAVNYHPDEVAFILIDYKGGGLTGAFEGADGKGRLPHLAGTITNLDGAAITRSLISIQSELRRRQSIFNKARKTADEGTMDIYKYQQLYRDKTVTEPVPHLFIISDEFAELKTQQPEFMEQLISAARIGRSLGVHLILATQKPNGVVDDQIWSNSKFRVCLKVQEKADSIDMIKCPDAAELSQTGRFYLQVGFNELFMLGQSAWCGAEYVPTDTVEKNVDTSVRVVDDLGRTVMNVKPAVKKTDTGSRTKQIVSIVRYLSELAEEEQISVRPLWLDAIPAKIFIPALEEKYGVRKGGTCLAPIVGEYDDPFNQKQDVLKVPFSDEGNCLIYGSAGSGKTTFLTTLCYSLIRNHTAEEVNIYIMDFGSETLRAFEGAPQVGGVVVSADEEKTINLLRMLQSELLARRTLFSEYGGDYASYLRTSGKLIPNIVVLLNNYAGFSEQFEEYTEAFTLLSRDGVKYGIYFAVTASATNAVRYKTQQNFRMMFALQLNDATDYSIVVGKTDGLMPSRYKGRGLAALDRVYEFQTAYCTDEEEQQDYLRSYCGQLAEMQTARAKQIPVLPDVVDASCVQTDGLRSVPAGINKKTLETAGFCLQDMVLFPVSSQMVQGTVAFAEEITTVLSAVCRTELLDAGHLTQRSDAVTAGFEEYVRELFSEMVTRNNTYKDAGMDAAVLDSYEERAVVILGVKNLFDQLSDDGKDKLRLILEKGETAYKIRFVLVDAASRLTSLNYENWYKKQITGTEGLWIGDGLTDQYVLKISKLTRELYEEIGTDFGYLCTHGKPQLIKVLGAGEGE